MNKQIAEDLVFELSKKNYRVDPGKLHTMIGIIYERQIDKHKNDLMTIVKSNKKTFGDVDLRKRESSQHISDLIKNRFLDYLDLPALSNALADNKTRGAAVSKITSTLSSYSPAAVLQTLISEIEEDKIDHSHSEHEGDTPSSGEKLPSTYGSIAKGLGISAMVASRQRTLLGGAMVLAGGAAKTLSYSGLGTSIKTGIKGLFRGKSASPAKMSFSGADYTPREEAMEKSRTEGKSLELLEQIEKNTRGGVASHDGTEKDGGSLVENLATILGPWVTKIVGYLTALAGGLGSLLLVLKGLPGLGLPKGTAPVPGRGGPVILGNPPKTGAPGAPPRKPVTVGGRGVRPPRGRLPIGDAVKPSMLGKIMKKIAPKIALRAGATMASGPLAPAIGIGMAAWTAYEVFDYLNNGEEDASSRGSIADKGSLTRHHESRGNYGAINPNDNGKPSYGAYQFREGSGLTDLMKIVSKNPKYGAIAASLRGKRPGTPEFDAKWKELAEGQHSGLFKQAQDEAWQKNYYNPATAKGAHSGFKVNDTKLSETLASAYTVSPKSATQAMLASSRIPNFKSMSAQDQGRVFIEHLEQHSKINKQRLAETKSYVSGASTNVSASQPYRSVAPSAPTVAQNSAPTTVINAPTTTTINNQNDSGEPQPARNHMNPIREFQFAQLAMP